MSNDVFVGLDWALHTHAVCVIDAAGSPLDRFEVAHDRDGLAELMHRLGRWGRRLRIAIERPSGLIVDALVEAHDAAELEVANRCGATIVGVNNRDLRTFETDLGTAERLASSVAAPTKVAESGVSTATGAARMAVAGYDAILVGEALVRSQDPAAFVAELRAAGGSSP